MEEPVAPPTAGMAELARRLKSVGAATGAAAAAPAPQPMRPRETVPAYALENLEQELARATPSAQAHPPAAQQARPAADPSVRIGPFRPDPSIAAARQAEAEMEHARAYEAARAATQPFIPPAAERPEDLQPRMPRVEDFPPVAQRQMRAKQQPAQVQEEDRRPRSLLARLASGLTRREEEDEIEAPRQTQRHAADAEPRVVASQHAPAPTPHPAATPASEFAKPQPRRMGEPAGAAGNLDPRGRPIPTEPARDDHLEIPAFLRRQSS
jgi:cell division protein FtsZ